jgi:hypothetical protein
LLCFEAFLCGKLSVCKFFLIMFVSKNCLILFLYFDFDFWIFGVNLDNTIFAGFPIVFSTPETILVFAINSFVRFLVLFVYSYLSSSHCVGVQVKLRATMTQQSSLIACVTCCDNCAIRRNTPTPNSLPSHPLLSVCLRSLHTLYIDTKSIDSSTHNGWWNGSKNWTAINRFGCRGRYSVLS